MQKAISAILLAGAIVGVRQGVRNLSGGGSNEAVLIASVVATAVGGYALQKYGR